MGDASLMTWITSDQFLDESSYTTTKSGLRYTMLPNTAKKGERVEKGSNVKVLYKLYLEKDHKHIYSQATLAEGFNLRVGGGSVIKGFDEAVMLMKPGDRGRFLMPGD